ncbi:MAG: archaeal proteasome endopeptidase complex subunit beta [Candidatus Lokiarchaeota archaeon]|nr:archaeal proteasome endopeptidase complex subunit beta [Candidatus Lokiarchaeota archaeon]
MNNDDLMKPSESPFVNKINIKTKETQHPKLNTFKTGTTTVGLVCKDAVILATDKRATMAYFVASKTSEKLHMIQEHLYMTIAGGVADAQYLIDVLRAETTLYQLKEEKPIRVKSAGKLLSNILYQNKMFPYEVGLILGGVTEEEGPTLLDIGAYGSILPEKFCAVGSGQNFSYGVLEAKYKENLTIEEGKNIIIKAVSSSIIRDFASGNGIDIAIIKKDSLADRYFIPIKE